MKFLYSLVVAILLSFPLCSTAQSSRVYIPEHLAHRIIDVAQPQLWSEMYMSTSDLITFYDRQILSIDYIDKYGFVVRVRTCTVLVLEEDL